MTAHWLAGCAAAIWLGVLLAPWRPWSTREQLDADETLAERPGAEGERASLADVTALVPARDEAVTLPRTLVGLRAQGPELRIIVVDDQSTDGTRDVARAVRGAANEILEGEPLPAGWVGKLWALEQGRRQVATPLVLLVDADIELRAGTLRALLAKRMETDVSREPRQLVSLMAVLEMETVWGKLLVPAFVYFFKLLYPFRLSNSSDRLVAAAAGGCVLVETAALERMGGFGVLKGAVIDDCALARRVKDGGGRTWIGLTHSVISHRRMESLGAIWRMVARSAFAQLRYSVVLLVACVVALGVAFWVAPLGLVVGDRWTRPLAVVALAAMVMSYIPVLRYYGRSPAWAVLLPLTGTLYLAMTVSSVFNSWVGRGVQWKGRRYRRRM